MEHPENDDQYKGLKVNKGIADVPTVNPYIKKRAQRKVYTPSAVSYTHLTLPTKRIV